MAVADGGGGRTLIGSEGSVGEVALRPVPVAREAAGA